MNKSLSLTALLFLAGPTLLTYGAQDDRERDRLREIQERDQERGKRLGRGLARVAETVMQSTLARSRHRAVVRDATGERDRAKELGLGLADSVQHFFQAISVDPELASREDAQSAVHQDAQSAPREDAQSRKNDLDRLLKMSEHPQLAQEPSSKIGHAYEIISALTHQLKQNGQRELLRNPQLACEYAREWGQSFEASINLNYAYQLACERESDQALEESPPRDSGSRTSSHSRMISRE